MKIKREIEFTDLHRDIFSYLQLVGVCRREAIQDHLNKKLGYSITDGELRRAKADLIDLGYPVGSSVARGYFIIYPDDPEALYEARRELILKAIAERRRSLKLKSNVLSYWRKSGDQLELFYQPPQRRA